MGIQVKTADSQPAVVFDKVHVYELKVEQPQFIDDSRPPYYVVTILYRMYGIDNEGKRHYQGNTFEIEVKDFFGVAMEQYNQGDPRLLTALGTIESAIAAIITQQMNVETQVT